MKKLLLVLMSLYAAISFSQSTISTNFTNNNGSSIITFNFQNTNATDVVITEIASATGLSGSNTATLWYNPVPINQTTMAVNTGTGWTQVASQPFTGVANTTTNVGQPMLTGLNLIVPAGATYGLCLSLTSSLRYSTITAGSYTFTGGGCNILTGTNIGFGGTLTSGINNRGFIGSVSFISGTNCSGTPNAGSTAASVNPVCPSVPFNLSLANATFTSGLNYQWQSAMNPLGPWTNIAGATTSTYSASQVMNTYYQCIVSCATSGQVDTSSALYVTTNTYLNCYCTSTATSTTYGDIQRVQLNTIDNSSTGCTGTYSDYTNLSTLVVPGVTYPMQLDLMNCTGGTYSYGTRVWIDCDHNGLFDTYELLQDSYNSLPSLVSVNVPFNITIPPTALSGLTRMRIVIVESNATPSPCGTYTWGETEDYMVNISAPPTCPQPTNFALNQATLVDAQVSWTAGGSETQWQIQYGLQGFALGSGTTLNVTTNPYTITGLTPNSFYQAYIRAVCSAGDSSYWTPVLSFNTFNQGEYIDWNADCPTGGFQDISATGTAANLAYLGEVGITLPFPLLYEGTLINTATIGNNGGMKLGTTTAQVNLVMEAGNGLYPFIQSLYTSYPIGSGGVFYQQVGTSPNSKFIVQWKNLPHYNSPVFPDGASFELIIEETTNEIYYVYDDVLMGSALWDYGQDAEIGVRGTQNINVSMNNSSYLQNNSCVHFYYTNCPKPSNLTASYIAPDQAMYTWTASAANETNWTVIYGPAGFDPTTGGTTLTTNTNTILLANLTPLQTYDVYVYSECSAGLTSDGLFTTFTAPPFCSNPTAFTANVGIDSLMSSWFWTPYTTMFPATGFNIQVVSQDSALYTGTVYSVDNNFNDTTWNANWYPGQAIDVYLQAVCGQDTSAYVGPISLIMPITNDNVCGAEPISVNAPGILYNNTGATVDPSENTIAPAVTGAQTTTGWATNTLNNTTWFSFIAPPSGNVRINATGVNYTGQMAVYFGTDCSIFPTFNLLAANDDAIEGGSSAANFTVCGLTPGTMYYVLHDGSTNATGAYTIAISEISLNAGVPGEVIDICYGASVNLFNGIANYQLGGIWDAQLSLVNVNGNTFDSYGYATMLFNFDYTMQDGCASDVSTAQVNVHEAPSAGNDGTVNVCLNEPIDLWLGLSGNIDMNGNWYDPNNVNLGGSLDTAANIAGQFNYDYIVGNGGICPNDTSNVLVIVDGSCDYTAYLEELAQGLNVFPNPTTGLFTVELNGLPGATITIYDIHGKMLISTQKLENQMNFSLNEYENGVYLVHVESNHAKVVQRIIKN